MLVAVFPDDEGVSVLSIAVGLLVEDSVAESECSISSCVCSGVCSGIVATDVVVGDPAIGNPANGYHPLLQLTHNNPTRRIPARISIKLSLFL